MSHAYQLVELYRGFYRAKNYQNSNSILRPLAVVSDALMNADKRLFSDPQALYEVAYGELYRFMERVGSGSADGRFPKGIAPEDRRKAMQAFCHYFVDSIFIDVFKGDVSALRGRQLNLLRSACEVIYRDAQLAEWEANRADAREQEDNDE